MRAEMKFIGVVILVSCLGIVGILAATAWDPCEPCGDPLEETARVMEFKTAWIECEEHIERYVEDSREIVCWDTLVDWQEQHEKEMRQCEGTWDYLMECESTVARMMRDWHPAHITPHLKKDCEEYACVRCPTERERIEAIAEILKVKDGTH